MTTPAESTPQPQMASSLLPGKPARIAAVRAPEAVHRRLMELGVCPGQTIALLGKSPFGDPAEYLVGGSRLAIRQQEAATIEVEMI
jgi:Fe2+ transport system protein FeoA